MMCKFSDWEVLHNDYYSLRISQPGCQDQKSWMRVILIAGAECGLWEEGRSPVGSGVTV